MEFFHRTWVEINLGNLEYNYNKIKELADGRKVCPVIKADAYGHGAVPVAQKLQACGADFFAVSNLMEAMELRDAGITGDILILGFTPAEYAGKLAQQHITQCVYSLDYARELHENAQKDGVRVPCHLKLDTGMGRIGFRCREDCFTEQPEAMSALSLSGLDFTGAFMHFAVADSFSADDVAYTSAQSAAFENAVLALEQAGHTFAVKHCCNSAGILNRNPVGMNMVRAGIILYGLAPSEQMPVEHELKPVMGMYSVVSHIKQIDPGDSINYGRTYIASTPKKIATVCAGYADGIPRLASGRASLLINGKPAPIVGRVCMDQLCVDVTDIGDVKIGDKVTIFDESLSVDRLAECANTINYEIVCQITKRVPRIYL